MRTIKVELPVEEALEVIRLLRAESRCLIENGDLLTDRDVTKRAQTALSARERIVSALEVFAEQEPPKAVERPPAIVENSVWPRRNWAPHRGNFSPSFKEKEDDWLMEQGTTLPGDRQSLAELHGVVDAEFEPDDAVGTKQHDLDFARGYFRSGRGNVNGGGTG
jgi:hypothetical protein